MDLQDLFCGGAVFYTEKGQCWCSKTSAKIPSFGEDDSRTEDLTHYDGRTRDD